VPTAVAERLREPLDQGRRRLIRHKVACELDGDVMSRRGMMREIGESCLPLLQPAIIVELTEQGMIARFVTHRGESESAPIERVVVRLNESPARDDPGKARDIGLAVAAVDAEGV